MTNPHVIEVIEVHELRGKGVEGDPYRRIPTYYSLDGVYLGEAIDPVKLEEVAK